MAYELAATFLVVIAAGAIWWVAKHGTKGFAGFREQAATDLAVKRFRDRRAELESAFFAMAAASGKPKGLRWERCVFQPAATLVRDKKTGALTAFVEVTIAFSAVEGGGMENVQAVGNLRNATALFHCQEGNWGTGGRALFNMAPPEAVQYFAAQYQVLSTLE